MPEPTTTFMASDEPAKLRLGGMALRNGLLVHGPTHWAAAVRRPDGTIGTASGRKPRLHGVEKLAGVRGVVRLAEAMIVIPLVKRALPEAKLPFQDAKVLAAMLGATAGGRLLRGHLKKGAGAEALIGAVSLLPSVVALRGGELAEYHGVEHKAIAAYENDAADAADAAKEHDRCGSHLMAPLLASNLAGSALLRRAVERPGPAAQFALGVASLGVAVEVFVWSERHAGSAVTRILRKPGHELQRLLGTREPSEPQLEVGRAALAEILRVEPTPVHAG
ncbi:MAG TPA: DUF1385 domain-containing protein [Solirubrobacteraceae bacterium]|nr:DUF1385 domain-containing protein [Solirubrobacteraceae bacterium]